MKTLIKLILFVVALVLAVILLLPVWIGPVVCPLSRMVVPKITQTDFNLGRLVLNPYTGRFEIGDLQLSNPSSYSERYAASLGGLKVVVDMGSVATPVVHVREVTISDVFVSYVSENGVNNFDQIKYNVAGGKEAYEAKQAEQARLDAQAAEKPATDAQAADDAKPVRRFVIDKLTISGLKVKLGFVPLALPPLTLTDIGKESQGATLAEIGDYIVATVLKAIGSIGDGAKALGSLLGDGASKALGVTGDAVKSVGDGASKALDATGDAVKSVGDGASKALDATGDAVKSVGDGAGKAVDAVKDAGKALKSLFN